MKYKNVIFSCALYVFVILGILFIDSMVSAWAYTMKDTASISLEVSDVISGGIRPVLLVCIAGYGVYGARKYLKFNKNILKFVIIEIVCVWLSYYITSGKWIYSGEFGVSLNLPFGYYKIYLEWNSFWDNAFGTFLSILGYSRSLFLAMCSLPFYILSSINKNKIT